MRAALIVPLLAAGCANTVHGSVNDQSLSLRDALFDEAVLTVPLVGDVHAMAVVLTDLPDACAVLDELADVDGNCEDQCDELGRIGEERLGRDFYWTASLILHVEDEVVRSYDQDEDWGHDEFVGTWTGLDVAGIYDLDECVEECQAGDDVVRDDVEEVIGGRLELTDHVEGERLAGSFELDFEGQEWLDGHFRASYCDLQEYFWFL